MSELKRVLLAVGMLCLGMSCLVVPVGRRAYVPVAPPAHGAVPVGPPPRADRFISQYEAVNIGHRYCQNHGRRCDLQEAHLSENNAVWKVKFRVHGWEKGHVHLDLDARNGSILKVNERVH
jgi:hypothetical protein